MQKWTVMNIWKEFLLVIKEIERSNFFQTTEEIFRLNLFTLMVIVRFSIVLNYRLIILSTLLLLLNLTFNHIYLQRYNGMRSCIFSH
jgi:hypothetical protein